MKKFALFAILASLLLVVPAFADVVVGEVGIGAQPGDLPPTICIYHRDIEIGTKANPPGINPSDYRSSLYAFTGERIKYTVVVRDPNGALDIGYVKAFVGGNEEALANPTNLPSSCNGLGITDYETDKAFEITITVEDGWYGAMEVLLKVFNSQNVATSATHSEEWFFNPELRMQVTTSDGQPIRFGPMDPVTRIAHSLNKIKVKNTAEGGVNLWVFIAGTDLFDTTGAAKCPTSNVLEIEKYMWYRGWSGTQWQSYEGWEQMAKYNQNEGCSIERCYNAKPIVYGTGGNFNPLAHVLTNGGLAEVEFKIQYPIPCIGTFNSGKIFIFGKAV
ncbi:MAG: hypothetical protein QW480_01935 [Candidatus Aenigmatarchaeota archaeon]